MASSAAISHGRRAGPRVRPMVLPPRPTRRRSVLEIQHLTKRFGGNVAVDDVSTTVEKGRINAIIGPNGAGKTTFFNLISGVHKPSSGSIVFEGQDITTLRPDRVARLGIARTFQVTTLFDMAT